MNKEEMIRILQNFTENNDFRINPDKKHVDIIIDGLLKNEKKYGLKLCPCRVRDGKREHDLESICPCNFKMHDSWKNKGMCLCGLFVKR